jgi:succinoglycan biosynthesis transport protein ExoP
MRDEEGFDLRRVFGAIRRRKILIAGLMIVATALATLYANQLQPLYSADTVIVIEGSRNNVINIETVAQGLPSDWRTNETEAAVIASRTVAVKVVDRLNLYENPLYNPAMMVIKPSLTKIALNRVKRLLGFNVPAVEAVTAPDPWEGMPPAQRRSGATRCANILPMPSAAALPSFRPRRPGW